MRRSGALLIAMISGLYVQSVYSCSDNFQIIDYIASGTGDRVLAMPNADFLSELCIHFGEEDRAVETRDRREKKSAASRMASREDFSEAISGYALDTESMTTVKSLYYQYLTDIRRPELIERKRVPYYYGRRFDDSPPEAYVTTRLENYPVLLRALPKEFELYLRGAAHYHTEHYPDAIRYWSALLELPPHQRQYRSVWAAFMLGKTRQKQGQADAVAYFEQCRELADAGFKDSLKLATSSYGWQARTELRHGQFGDALHHYVALFQEGDDFEQHDAYQSLRTLCWRLFRAEAIPAEVTDNPVAREVVSLWILSGGYSNGSGEKWLAALAKLDDDQSPFEAGRMAWLAYTGGDMGLAEQWVAMAGPEDFVAQWVQSKLYLRAGNIEAAESILHELDRGPQPTMAFEEQDGYFGNECPPKMSRIKGDLATLYFNQGMYNEAFDEYVRGDYLYDAHFVANGVLPISEHQAALDRVNLEENLVELTKLQLNLSLARRLARNGDHDAATRYYPARWDGSYRLRGENWTRTGLDTVAADFAKSLAAGNDKGATQTARGEAILHAAEISEGCGSSLFGAPFQASRTYVDSWLAEENPFPIRVDGITEEVQKRIETYAPTPSERKPYGIHRYKTADLYWEAAKLLPDNDDRTAYALWRGGMYLAAYEPEAADRFYKALVKRCSKLPIGEAADKQRWFPSDFELNPGRSQ